MKFNIYRAKINQNVRLVRKYGEKEDDSDSILSLMSQIKVRKVVMSDAKCGTIVTAIRQLIMLRMNELIIIQIKHLSQTSFFYLASPLQKMMRPRSHSSFCCTNTLTGNSITIA